LNSIVFDEKALKDTREDHESTAWLDVKKMEKL